jgi:hypothetical protein
LKAELDMEVNYGLKRNMKTYFRNIGNIGIQGFTVLGILAFRDLLFPEH